MLPCARTEKTRNIIRVTICSLLYIIYCIFSLRSPWKRSALDSDVCSGRGECVCGQCACSKRAVSAPRLIQHQYIRNIVLLGSCFLLRNFHTNCCRHNQKFTVNYYLDLNKLIQSSVFCILYFTPKTSKYSNLLELQLTSVSEMNIVYVYL